MRRYTVSSSGADCKSAALIGSGGATPSRRTIYGEAGVKVAQKIVALWVVGSIPLFPTMTHRKVTMPRKK